MHPFVLYWAFSRKVFVGCVILVASVFVGMLIVPWKCLTELMPFRDRIPSIMYEDNTISDEVKESSTQEDLVGGSFAVIESDPGL